MAYTRISQAGYSGNSGIILYTEYQLLGQNTSARTSTVRFQLVGHAPSGSASWDSAPSGSYSQLVVGGTQVHHKANPPYDYRTAGTYKVFCTVDTTITHNANGDASVSVKGIHVCGPAVSLGRAETNGTLTLPKISTTQYSKITSGLTNFNDVDHLRPDKPYHLKLTYTGCSSDCNIQLYCAMPGYENFVYRSITPIGGGTYNLVMTETELAAIYAATQNSDRVNVSFRWCTYRGTKQLLVNEKTVTVTVLRGTPTFSDSSISVKDTNATTTALTGNSATFIKGKSTVEVTISTKAVGGNGASIARYEATLGNVTKTAPESSGPVTFSFPNCESDRVLVKAVDSRGGEKTVTKAFTTLPYAPVSVNEMTLTRSSGGVGESVTFSYRAKFWNGNFGTTTNSITAKSIRYKKTTAQTWTDSSATISQSNNGDLITGSASLGVFNVAVAYDIEFTIKDRLTTTVTRGVLYPAQPALKIKGNKVTVGQEGFFMESSTGAVKKILDLVYPVGSIYMSVNSINPGTLFGGTWSQLQGRFLLGQSSTYPNGSTGGKSSVELRALVGAVDNDIGSIAYASADALGGTHTGFKLSAAHRGTSLNFNHATPVRDVLQNNNTTNIMPPYLAVYMWKRTA